MAKLLASFVFILLVVNSKCLIEIELVERENSSDSAESRQLDDVVTRIVHTVIDNFDEYVAGRDETHVEYLEEQRNVNGAITYTLGARLPGWYYFLLASILAYSIWHDLMLFCFERWQSCRTRWTQSIMAITTECGHHIIISNQWCGRTSHLCGHPS